MQTDPWLVLNWALRGATIAMSLMLGALLLRQHARRVPARLGAAFAIGAAAFALHTGPGFLGLPAGWAAPVVAVATANTLVFWLFARSLLDDDFRLRPWHGLAWIAFAGLAAVDCALGRELGRSGGRGVGLTISVATVLLALMAVGEAVASWRSDLVEARRRLRFFVVAGVAAHILSMQVIAFATGTDLMTAFASIGNAAVLLALNAAFVWKLLRLPEEVLFAALAPDDAPAAPRMSGGDGVSGPASPPPAGRTDDPADRPAPDPRLIASLNELMTVEQVYREDNLSIGALAQRLKLPEHRLRRLINQGLGHRNFHAFLNAYRVDDARRSLADVRYDAVPILTIAMEAGFQSIGPFNRAFKAATGMTPTDFRREARTPAAGGDAESTHRSTVEASG